MTEGGPASTGAAACDRAALTFIGTATTLLRFGPFTLLTDPNFVRRGQRVGLGYGLWSKRLTQPAARVDDLPDLDAVLLSHLHGDHFDRVARRRLPRSVPVLTTPQAAARLQRWGFGDTLAMRPWQSTTLRRDGHGLRITSVPGTHGPGVVGRVLMPQVMGSVLEWYRPDEAPPLRVYITGDVLYRQELTAVVDRFGDLDAMVAHLGGTRILGLLLTMDARQGADLVELLRPRLTVPVHYDDYPVFRSPLRDFLAEAARRGLPGEIRPVPRGARLVLPSFAGSPSGD
ncbi:MAG TPA: MBL fold metallo-hydrolase [Micromonosporaceae bacterium]